MFAEARDTDMTTAGLDRPAVSIPLAQRQPPAGETNEGSEGAMAREFRFITEFRDFLLRGNVVDLAVAIVIGVSFGAIVTSLVEDILTPLLGIVGIPDFSTWTISIGEENEIRIGAFLNTLISFVLVGASIFFLIVKPMEHIESLIDEDEPAGDSSEPEADPIPSEVELLIQIRDELRKRSA